MELLGVPLSPTVSLELDVSAQQQEFVGFLALVNTHYFGASEFQLGVICVVLSEQQISPDGTGFWWYSLTRICVCCSSVTLDWETIEYPGTLAYHPRISCAFCAFSRQDERQQRDEKFVMGVLSRHFSVMRASWNVFSIPGKFLAVRVFPCCFYRRRLSFGSVT